VIYAKPVTKVFTAPRNAQPPHRHRNTIDTTHTCTTRVSLAVKPYIALHLIKCTRAGIGTYCTHIGTRLAQAHDSVVKDHRKVHPYLIVNSQSINQSNPHKAAHGHKATHGPGEAHPSATSRVANPASRSDAGRRKCGAPAPVTCYLFCLG